MSVYADPDRCPSSSQYTLSGLPPAMLEHHQSTFYNSHSKTEVFQSGSMIQQPDSYHDASSSVLPQASMGVSGSSRSSVEVNEKRTKAEPLLGSMTLPPCAVCGEKSTGFHYGANTCQACKGFFRRCLVRSTKHECNHTTAMGTGVQRKHMCPACRYRRCIAAGMSVTAIKTGRYTHAKRTRDTEEIKKLQLQSKITTNGTLMQSTEDRSRELDKMIQTISKAQLTCVNTDPELMSHVRNCEKRCTEWREISNSISGSLQLPPDRQTSKQIYLTSRTKESYGRQHIAQLLVAVEFTIRRLITFIKALPGFKQLPSNDKVILSKGATMEWWMFSQSRWLNAEQRDCNHCEGSCLVMCSADLCKVRDADVDMDMFWTSVKRIQMLNLNRQEEAIVIALSIVIADVELSHEGQVLVSASQDFILEALQYLLSHRNNCDPSKTLAQIMTIITDIRSLHDLIGRSQGNIVKDANDVMGVDIPPLYLEYFSKE